MKQHKELIKDNRWGGHTYMTLCGRSSSKSMDGMNVADTENEITCKLCIKKMEGK